MIVPTEVPLGVAILIILPYFVLTIAVIIYTYKIEKSRIITNENPNSKSSDPDYNNSPWQRYNRPTVSYEALARGGSYVGRHNRQ